MPAVQTTYNAIHTPAVAGMVANTEHNFIISRVVEGAAVSFGIAVDQGTNDQAVVVSHVGGVFRGISVLSTVEAATIVAFSVDTYAVGSVASVMTKGVVWIVASAAVSAGQAAFVNAGTGGISADVSGVAIPALFDTSGAAGALVKLRLA